MNDIDDLIKRALCDDDARWFEELDEQTMREMVIDSFRGKRRWFVLIVYVFIGLFTLMAVVSAVELFRTAELAGMITWAVAFLFCCLVVAMMKIWYWMELNKNATIREMKRIELQLARLSSRLGSMV